MRARLPARLVIGIGNDMRRDDGAGLAVVRLLRDAGITAVALGGDPVGLLDAWAGAEDVVVVDAVASGAAPGTIHRLDPVAAPLDARFRGSTHLVSVAETIELARALGRLPRQLTLYGIEGADFTAGPELTPAVERAVRELSAALGS